MIELRRLRNAVVRGLGYPDYFSYMVSEYGMTTEEMAIKIEEINRDLRPLFRELHTWARYELARRFGQPVPDQMPAHWLPNRWGQDWSSLVEVQGFDLDAALARKSPQWLVEQAERFYVSLGLEPLPRVFWDKSSLYPAPVDAGYKKNNHASAWHMDLDRDVRSLMASSPMPSGTRRRTTSSATSTTTCATPTRACRRCCARARTVRTTRRSAR